MACWKFKFLLVASIVYEICGSSWTSSFTISHHSLSSCKTHTHTHRHTHTHTPTRSTNSQILSSIALHRLIPTTQVHLFTALLLSIYCSNSAAAFTPWINNTIPNQLSARCFHCLSLHQPGKHTTSQKRRYNVAATSWRCSDVVTTLWRRYAFAGSSL